MIREEFVSTAMAIIFEHRFVTDPKAMDEWAQAGTRMVHTGSYRYPYEWLGFIDAYSPSYMIVIGFDPSPYL